MKKENVMIAINSCNKVIDIFLGPFLVAYFIKVSADSMIDLSVFKILNYFFLASIGLLVGFFIEKGHPLATFRVGVITRFFYILTILIMGENIVNHLTLISLLYGFSTITFWLPFNQYRAECTNNKDRAMFESKMKAVSGTIGILVPAVLGTMITTTSYQVTAIIILVFSLIEIIYSFYLMPLPKTNRKYDLKGAFKTFIKDKQMKKLLIADYFNGITISDGVMGTLITILIINLFKTDMNLGIINSLSAVLAIIAAFIYSKYYKGKSDKKFLYLSAILPIISVLLLVFMQTKTTVIIETFIFEIFATGMLSFIFNLRMFNIAKSIITDEMKTEYWSLREVILNLGRITGYLLMLFIGIMGIEYLNIVLILVSLSLLEFAYIIANIDKNEEC